MIREAEALASEGHEVHVIALRPVRGRSPAEMEGVYLHELPLTVRRGGAVRYLYQYAMFFALATAVLLIMHLKHRFQLVHVHSLPDAQVFCTVPLRLLGVPVLLDLHESMPELLMARFSLTNESPIVKGTILVQALSCWFASHTVVACEGIRERLLSRRVDPERVSCVYNAVEDTGTPSSPEELRSRFQLSQGINIVHAGGINTERDLETAVRALARLRPEYDIDFVVVGDGDREYISHILAISIDLGLDGHIRFIGRLSPSDARALMSISPVGLVTLVSNPHTNLAWPARVAEYTFLRKPLIVPRLRFLSQMLDDSARFYIPGDAESLAEELRASLSDPAGNTQRVARAETVCRKYDWQHARVELLRICDNLVGLNAIG